MKKVIGIILIVLGALAVFGSIVNGTFASYSQQNIGFILGNILGYVLLFGGGIYLISKSKK